MKTTSLAALAAAILLSMPAPVRSAVPAPTLRTRPVRADQTPKRVQTTPREVRPAQQRTTIDPQLGRGRFRITATKLRVVRGSGEFESLGDEHTVAARESLLFQWTTELTDAASGRWEVRNVTAGGAVVASGVSSPAPQPGHFLRFRLDADEFLFAEPPPYNTVFEVSLQTRDGSGQPLGAPSNGVKITQLSEDNQPPPTQFGDGAYFPSVRMLSFEQHVGQIPLTQLYSSYADVRVRVRNGLNRSSDPMWLKLKDHSLLFRDNSPGVEVPSLAPGAEKVYTIRVDAILPPPKSQTPQAQQVREWRQAYEDRCGPELRSLLDWRGPQSQTPMDAHREQVLAFEGWNETAPAAPSRPICRDGKCVRVSDIENSIRRQLHGKVVGYSYAVGASPLRAGAGGWARTAADGGVVDFTSATPITVASVSKWITAIAAMRVLRSNQVNLNDPIGPFFPADWNVGSYFQNVTFRQLLGQRSGIKDYGNVTLTYARLRQFFEQPVSNSWTASCTGAAVVDPPMAVNPGQAMTRCYSNYNFAILRVLLPAVAGFAADPDPATRPQTLADQYELLVRQNVFERVGSTDTGCRPRGPLPHAFAHAQWSNAPGFDWGDVRLECGGAGWYLSAEDMGEVLQSLSSKDGRIFVETTTESQFDDMLSSGLGVDNFSSTFLEKNGGWGAGGGSISTSAAIFGPASGPRVVGVLFLNSDVAGGCSSARRVLANAYNGALYTP